MLSGEMDMTFEPISVMVGHVREGKVIPLAVTGAARSPELPDVPTMIESGYPGFVSMSWTGIVAPAGTPPEVVAKLNRAVIDSFRSKEASESLARLGAEPNFGTPESFGAMIAAEIPKWAETVRAAGVRLD
jgi:tripartite-type tricarboxylate transporter receptor subunit TctC